MLSIQSNMLAMNANNLLQINSKRNKRTTEKLSSGYRINRAADDAAGLTISEKMRRQLRGLTQGTANAQDGISFVQVADGSMDEVHNMLQRMNELALKSLNGTYTDSDRAALNAEFDQLRTEIDRINIETEYNEQPVFEEHEDSFYQITGNRRWNDNQLHNVPSLANELNIHLPANYNPSDYTLTVPAGTYTTQELIDEIDSALERMTPTNPGFVFEYTDNGICKLNFENAYGMPTEISSVDGPLSYLFYDSYNGSSSTSLLGTTVFDSRYPLTIISGQNDELGFYVENANGSNFVSMKIPAGNYTRTQMINLINKNLDENTDIVGVKAKEYEDSSIQITGDNSTSITGLKGNMFKLETSSVIYSSVFYDNVKYGISDGTPASVSGCAYYNSSIIDKIDLSGSNQNNVLRFKINGAADYTEITFADKAGGYTILDIVNEINRQLEGKGAIASVEETNIDRYNPNTSGSYKVQYIKLSSTIGGSSSSLEFDTTPNSVYANTYNDLFRNTDYLPYRYTGSNASLYGYANLKGEIKLSDDASLTFNIDNQTYTINNIGGSYTSRNDLVDELNDYIQKDSAFSAVKDKIKFASSGNSININAQTADIQKIYFIDSDKNDTYRQLFVGTRIVTYDADYDKSSGEVEHSQGSTGVKIVPATASVVIPGDRRTNPIVIDSSSNIMEFRLQDNYYASIKLDSKTYNGIAGIVSELNNKLTNSSDDLLKNTRASYKDNKLIFTLTPSMDSDDGIYMLSIYSYSSALKPLVGHPEPEEPGVYVASKSILRSHGTISDTTTLDGNNNELILNIGQNSATINIGTGAYSKEALKNALQQEIDKYATLKDKVTVNITDNGNLEFNSTGGSITASGSFYKNVIINTLSKNESVQKGEYDDDSFDSAYIIGRKDLKAESVDIISGANDTFTFDFAYTDYSNVNSYDKQIDIKIPEGTYTGDEIASVLQEKIQEKFDEENIDDLEVKVSVGGILTGVVGSNDDTALQIVVNRKAGKEPAAGQYVLDGVRGSAASFLFYKTTNKPKETYIAGTKDLSKGIIFKSGQNVLTLSADSQPYKYTFPENTKYTADEFISLLNDMFKNGDDNGNSAPLTASLENGTLKIAHKALGTHTITDIGGNARSALFLEESGRNFREPIYLLVGAETKDMVEIPRTRVGSCSLAINSITISKPKYAEKAVNRIKEAITMLSSRRSTYGAMQNRLEHTINNNNNVIENTQASESAIRDADIAYEVMEQSKNNFLMQASHTILAQANQLPNLVLDLLR